MKPYIVLGDFTPNGLEDLARIAIARGYVCQGGVSSCKTNGGMHYTQAMILKPGTDSDLVKVQASPHG